MNSTLEPFRVVQSSVSLEVSETGVSEQQATASPSSWPCPSSTTQQLQTPIERSKPSQRKPSCQAASNPPVFAPFLRLPPEVRNMIWLYNLSPRVITVNHKPSYLTRFETPSRPDIVHRSNIRESYPSLLAVCHESRSLILPFYTSIFPSPHLGPLKWRYTGSLKPADLASVQKKLGLMLLISLGPTNPKPLIKSLEATMNSHPPAFAAHQHYTSFATLYRKPTGTVNPAFFNPSLDTIYLQRLSPPWHWMKGRFMPGLWSPKKNLQAHTIRHLAIELDNLTYPGPHNSPRHTRRWCNQFASKALTGLESLSLICLDDREIISFTLDTSDLLGVGGWSYSLSLSPPEINFKAQIREMKTRVTWNVHLAPVEGKNLWELVKAWRPVWVEWEDEKRTICEGLDVDQEMIGREWWNLKRVHGFYRMGRKPEVLGGGDGKTWVGKSRAGG